jgi:UDP-galactopyranose mutase
MNLVCFSHLRWDFVFQRPQHLLTRFRKAGNSVYYIEEAIWTTDPDHFSTTLSEEGVRIIVPYLQEGKEGDINERTARLITEILGHFSVEKFTAWYYTPMALSFTRHLNPERVIFDAMDELANFKFAPEGLKELEAELMEKSDVVFTGGYSLYDAKKHRHHNIHAFPSSIDKAHFGKARLPQEEPADQAGIAGPRIGFFGVVDERFDIELLRGMAALRPDWQFVIIGPVVKIDFATLPQASNIHYLGGKSYRELPSYIGGWDAALIPFALNESTKFISPTKTPEYLAGGCPVISTAIRDVIHPYADEKLVEIVDSPESAIEALSYLLTMDKAAWLKKVDAFLENISWEDTWSAMNDEISKIKITQPVPECTTTLS